MEESDKIYMIVCREGWSPGYSKGPFWDVQLTDRRKNYIFFLISGAVTGTALNVKSNNNSVDSFIMFAK